MARPIDEFLTAWSALLVGGSTENGWRGIHVPPVGTCQVLAARQYPGGEESLLVEFPSVRILASEKLPEAKGFEVAMADPHCDGRSWLAISRRSSGSIELFSELVGDVVGAMDAAVPSGEDAVLRAMLRRVRMWQYFMGKGATSLSPEAEIGLAGELIFLSMLIDHGLDGASAVGSWVGPEDAPQDFRFGVGAIEVKATVATSGFRARVGSLEQLDDTIISPLFLAGVRLSTAAHGRTLSELVEFVSGRLSTDLAAVAAFGEKLLAAGYLASHAANFRRRFSCSEIRVFAVTDGFPRLVPGSVPAGVIKANYDLELSRISAFETEFSSTLEKLGATHDFS